MPDFLDLREFFIEGSDSNASHVLLHITEPTTPSEYRRGYFFALFDVANGGTKQLREIQSYIDDIEARYYDEDEDHDFESLLEAVNRKASSLFSKKHIQIDCIVGVIQGNAIRFSYHGNPTAILFYHKGGALQATSILPAAKQESPGKVLFSAMLEGKLQTNDYFYIATPQVAQTFSVDRLLKIVSSRSLKQAIAHVSKVLQSLRMQHSYGGLFFHLVSESDKPKTGKRPAHLPVGSTESMQHLHAKRDATNETLSPKIVKQAKKKLQPHVQETNHRQRPRDPKEPMLQLILISFGKALVIFGISVFRFMRAVVYRLWKMLVGIIILISNVGNNRQTVLDNAKSYMVTKQESIKALPLLSKVLFVCTLIFAVVFVGSIWYLRAAEAKDALAAKYTQTVQAVVDKKDAADAAMIYGDDTKAFRLLKEAEGLLGELPVDTAERETKKGSLSAEIDVILQKLRKVTLVSPTVLTDLSGEAEQVKATRLAHIGDSLIAFGPEDTNHYVVDKDTATVDRLSHEAIAALSQASTPKEDDTVVFVTGNNGLAAFDPENNTIGTNDIAFPEKDPRIVGITVYNQRVYSLDEANSQIYKHNKTQTGFDQGAAWLKETVDLSGAVSITIDGDIYVLTSEGELFQFAKGLKQSFTVADLDPALSNPTIVWTYNDIEHLYILEPTNKRVVVLTKEGRLVTQYSSLDWVHPTGMVVDEEASAIYVLDEQKIYRFEI